MALIEFACPHCRGQFQLDNPPAGGQAACPLCHQILAIPTELPPPAAGGALGVGPLPFDPGELSAAPRRTQRPNASALTDIPIIEPLSREEQDRRRQVRGLVWMIAGILVLAIAAAVLSRL